MTQKNISQEKLHANQQNAKHSTGPRTDQGKQRSSQNALKHGLLAQQAVLPDESLSEYDGHLTSLEQKLQPTDFLEFALLRQMVDAEWRLRRLTRIETSIAIRAVAVRRSFWTEVHNRSDEPSIYGPADTDSPETREALRETEIFGDAMSHQDRTLDTYSRYGARLTRQFDRAISQFTRIREIRIGASQPQADNHHLHPRPPQSEPQSENRYSPPPPPSDPFTAGPPAPPHDPHPDPNTPVTLQQSHDPAVRARLRGDPGHSQLRNTKPTHQPPTSTNKTTYQHSPTEPGTQVTGPSPHGPSPKAEPPPA